MLDRRRRLSRSLLRSSQSLCRVLFPVATLSFGPVSTSRPALAVTSRDIQGSLQSHPQIKSATALIVDLNTNEVLFEREADTVRPVASLSKIVSSMVIQSECALDPNGLHEMTSQNREAAKGGDKSKLTTGWSFSHADLMHAALMRSDNRALPALGEACGLTPSDLGEKMTLLARKLGLTKTAFKEPNGLSPDNVSTAREMMILLREVLKFPELTEIMLKKQHDLVAHKDGRGSRVTRIRNTDRLLENPLAQILGAKTGYTDLARYCFAVAARTPVGHQLGMIFLGGEGRFTRFADFTRVIQWLRADKGQARLNPSVDQASRAPLALDMGASS